MPIFTKFDCQETEIRMNGESLSRLNRVIDYVHAHYSENLDLNKMADIACLSPFHFHRQFNAVIGETPSQFIRRIRLEMTAHKLMLESCKPITQIASDCGFSSSQNFSRSFKAKFYANPSFVRKVFNWYSISNAIQKITSGKTVKDKVAFMLLKMFVNNRNLSLRSLLDEEPPDNVEIKTIPSCRVAYVRTIGAAYSYDAVKPAFKRLFDWAIPKGLIKQDTFLQGVAWCNPDLTPADRLIYDVCVKVPDDVKGDNWVSVQTLPGGEYAAYRSLAEVRQHVNKNEFMRLAYWLFFSDYRPEVPPYYNFYLNRAQDHPQGLADIELCVPVVPLKMK